MNGSMRPPAVPLVTVDPYFNIWSASNQLHASETRHWTGKTNGMVGMAIIDGKAWRFMGGHDRRSDFHTMAAEAMTQIGLQVLPLSSVYTFKAAGVTLQVDFTTPLLPDDLDALGRPASYVTFTAFANDGNTHSVQIYYDMTAELCVDVPALQHVAAFRETLPDGSEALLIGSHDQRVLNRSGDDVRIDWGYACLVVPAAASAATAIASVRLRDKVGGSSYWPESDDSRFPRRADEEMPVLAALLDLGQVGGEPQERFLVLAYDDIESIDYFGRGLPGYWKRNGQTRGHMLAAAVREYPSLKQRCREWNERIDRDAREAGGDKYADILSLAYRQAVAAHKLVAGPDGEVLFFSKENFSNGCMATVDVSYPSIPLFLLYNPELVKGMMRPVFRYAGSAEWPYEFAPHDVGRYPLAIGQAYGLQLERQMPIEECGNMLIMAAAVCVADGKPDFALEHWELLRQWSDYLLKYGMDPGNQLCTDDFGGHLAHNANLSVKAIVAVACFGLMCRMRGDEEGGALQMKRAQAMAVEWERMAREGDHYRLAFDAPGTWSMKYNMVWDSLFGLDIFPADIRRKEVEQYVRQRNRYGTPLDSRQTYTKSDWLLWVAAMADTREQFETLIDPLWDFLNETSSRVPMTDWYYTIDGRMTGFVNRSVVGGLFIQVLAHKRILLGD